MIQKIGNAAFLFFLLQSAAYAQTFNKAKLDSFFVTLNKNDQSMGCIAISANGVLVYQNAIGYSHISEGLKTPATIDTKYRIGSISKMFTAVMILQLIDEGKLKFETPLAAYFPQIPNSEKITVSQMLSHRSGLYEYNHDSLYVSYATTHRSQADMIAMFARQKSVFEPDTKAEYSNTNFVLLGYIIEKLTGKTYAEELKKRIAAKIGLTNTYYTTRLDPARGDAYSYNYAGQWLPATNTDLSIVGGAGGLTSTPADLTKFINVLFAGKLVSPASLELMKTMRDNYGIGMFAITFDNKKAYEHDGGIDGFTSRVAYFPQQKLAISYTANGVRYPTYDLVNGVLSIYFNKPFTLPEFKTVSLTTAELDKYLGNYTSTQISLKIAVTKKDATLYVQATGYSLLPLEAKGDHKFIYATANITLQFDPVKNSFTLIQGGIPYLFTKTN